MQTFYLLTVQKTPVTRISSHQISMGCAFFFDAVRSTRARCTKRLLHDKQFLCSAWSTEGLRTVQVNGTHARCHTTHFTSFAILTQYTEVQVTLSNMME